MNPPEQLSARMELLGCIIALKPKQDKVFGVFSYPDYIHKKGGENMLFSNKIEVISFKEFMSPPAPTKKEIIPLTTSIFSFLPTFTMKGFFPIHDLGFSLFLFGSCAVAAFAFSETLFAHGGFIEVSEGFSNFLKVILPLVGYGLIFWLFSTI